MTNVADFILCHPWLTVLGCFGSIPIIEWVM